MTYPLQIRSVSGSAPLSFQRQISFATDRTIDELLAPVGEAPLIRRSTISSHGGFDVLDHLPDMRIQDCEQDRLLGVEVVIERTARQLAGVREVGDRGAHVALGRKQPGGIGQDAQVDAVVILRACSRHGMSSASIQL